MGAVVALLVLFLLLSAVAYLRHQAAGLRLAEQRLELLELENRSLRAELETEKLLHDAQSRYAPSRAEDTPVHLERPIQRRVFGARRTLLDTPVAGLWWDETRQQGDLVIAGLPPTWSGGMIELQSGAVTLTLPATAPAEPGRLLLPLRESPPPGPATIHVRSEGANDILLHER